MQPAPQSFYQINFRTICINIKSLDLLRDCPVRDVICSNMSVIYNILINNRYITTNNKNIITNDTPQNCIPTEPFVLECAWQLYENVNVVHACTRNKRARAYMYICPLHTHKGYQTISVDDEIHERNSCSLKPSKEKQKKKPKD